MGGLNSFGLGCLVGTNPPKTSIGTKAGRQFGRGKNPPQKVSRTGESLEPNLGGAFSYSNKVVRSLGFQRRLPTTFP